MGPENNAGLGGCWIIECLLPYLSMVTLPHIMVKLEGMLDYRGVGLKRFHCTIHIMFVKSANGECVIVCFYNMCTLGYTFLLVCCTACLCVCTCVHVFAHVCCITHKQDLEVWIIWIIQDFIKQSSYVFAHWATCAG